MNLFIRIVDGNVFEHPIMEENFKQAFIGIDTENLPKGFAKFVRVEPPVLGVFEKYVGSTYEFVDGVYTDIHHIVEISEEEKLAKIEEARKKLRSNWTLDEETLTPIIPTKPVDGEYRWDEETLNWIQLNA